MASLIAKTPCEGLVPVAAGGVRLAEERPGAVWSVVPFRGQAAAVSAALKAAHGVPFPAPGESHAGGDARILWFGRGQAVLLGAAPPELPGAALTDQSDGWAALRLDGAGARAVLARLSPLDLRPSEFAEGRTARTLLGHMNASITRVGAEAYLILVFRSMARTAVHEIAGAMRSAAAEAALKRG